MPQAFLEYPAAPAQKLVALQSLNASKFTAKAVFEQLVVSLLLCVFVCGLMASGHPRSPGQW